MRAVFFDFDGVLTRDRTGSLTTLRALNRLTGIGLERLQAAFRPFNADLNLGRVSHADIWPAVCDALGEAIDIGLLAAAYESTPLNGEMFDLARELRGVGLQVGIITDNKADRMAFLRAHARLADLFDPIVVSAEVKCGKGDARIFRAALQAARVAAEASLFIDNTAENLVAARELGMQVLHFDDEANDVAALRRTLRAEYGLLEGVACPSTSTT